MDKKVLPEPKELSQNDIVAVDIDLVRDLKQRGLKYEAWNTKRIFKKWRDMQRERDKREIKNLKERERRFLKKIHNSKNAFEHRAMEG